MKAAAIHHNSFVADITALAKEIEDRVSKIIKERPEVTVSLIKENHQQKVLAKLRTDNGEVFIAQDRDSQPERSVNNITYKLLQQLKKKRGSRLSKRRRHQKAELHSLWNDREWEQEERTECA